MATYGTLNIENITSSTGGVISPNITSLRNRIINGAMVINQRANTPLSVTSGTANYSVDRFYAQCTSGSFTVTQSTSAPVGFTNSILVNVTSAVASPAATDVFTIAQVIEGYNIADLQEGTANAKSFTVSFWVKSNLTGTFCVGLRNSAGDAGYAATYTISVANTWQYVTLTIPGTALGTWVTNNTAGLYVIFDMGSGSNRNITANTWVVSSGFNTSTQTNVMASTSNNFSVTGVQLEVGAQATSFDYRPYGTELMLCQRYLPAWTSATSGDIFAGGGVASATYAYYTFSYLVSPRVIPTGLVVSSLSTFTVNPYLTGGGVPSSIVFSNGGTRSARIYAISSGMTQGGYVELNGSSGSQIYFTGCEL